MQGACENSGSVSPSFCRRWRITRQWTKTREQFTLVVGTRKEKSSLRRESACRLTLLLALTLSFLSGKKFPRERNQFNKALITSLREADARRTAVFDGYFMVVSSFDVESKFTLPRSGVVTLYWQNSDTALSSFSAHEELGTRFALNR